MVSGVSARPLIPPRTPRAGQRGHRGGAILPHRSIWSLQLPLHRLGVGLLIALGYTGLLVLLQAPVAGFWGWQMAAWLQALGLQATGLQVIGQSGQSGLLDQMAALDEAGASLLSLPVPVLDLALPDVSNVALAAHGLACMGLWIAAGWLPDSGKPGTYVLRFGVLIHAAAVLYFGLWPGSFAHSLSGHVSAGLRQSWMLLLFTPWLHLCTYYLFPFTLLQRLGLTGLTLLYLGLLAPLQYTSHAVLLVLAGPVLMPLLHLMFGVMVPILGLVALYGWGMSWHDPQGSLDARHAG